MEQFATSTGAELRLLLSSMEAVWFAVKLVADMLKRTQTSQGLGGGSGAGGLWHVADSIVISKGE